MNKKILIINSSPMNEKSISRGLVDELVQQIKNKNTNYDFVERDLSKNPIPHLNAQVISAANMPENQRNDQMKNDLKLSDELINEFLNAEIIIIGAPMWNFSIPSVLKAWIDYIMRINITFGYNKEGVPVGLLSGSNKKIIIASSRRGIYSEGQWKSFDHQETLLQGIFNYIGITDICFIRAEGLRGENAICDAINLNIEKINNIVERMTNSVLD